VHIHTFQIHLHLQGLMKKPTAKTITKPKPQAAKPTVTKPGDSKSVSLRAATDEAGATAKPEPKKAVNPLAFFREVRLEARKITWPTRKETWITTVMVLLMVVIATVFFALIDLGFGTLTSLLLKGQV
jgi:preprotein translocase subunit SecE